jgi:homoaconitate hydratase
MMVVGADSHSCSSGGLGTFSIGLGAADTVLPLVTGETWIKVPETIKIEYSGNLKFGIGGKDVILYTMGKLKRNTVAFERVVEYAGNIKALSCDSRFAISNMTAEFGGISILTFSFLISNILFSNFVVIFFEFYHFFTFFIFSYLTSGIAGIFEADEVTASYIAKRPLKDRDQSLYFRADTDAKYAEVFTIPLEEVDSMVALYPSPDNVVPVTEVAGKALDGCFIGKI